VEEATIVADVRGYSMGDRYCKERCRVLLSEDPVRYQAEARPVADLFANWKVQDVGSQPYAVLRSTHSSTCSTFAREQRQVCVCAFGKEKSEKTKSSLTCVRLRVQ